MLKAWLECAYVCMSLTFFCALLGLESSSEFLTFDLVRATFFSFGPRSSPEVKKNDLVTKTVCAHTCTHIHTQPIKQAKLTHIQSNRPSWPQKQR